MQQAGFHHANMLADQLRNNLQVQSSAMLVMVQDLAAQDNNPPIVDSSPPKPVANVYIGDSVQLKMLRLLREIARDRQGGSGWSSSRAHNLAVSGDAEGGRGRTRKTLDNAIFLWHLIDCHCWTHGGCNHDSRDYRRKALGHKDAATRANRMSGSNAFCQSCED